MVKLPPIDDCVYAGILIGRNVPRFGKIRQSINGPPETPSVPWARRIDLEWTVIGEICPNQKTASVRTCHTTHLRHNPCPCGLYVDKTLKLFNHVDSERIGLSRQDKAYLQFITKRVTQNDAGNLELPQPSKVAEP